MTPPKKKRIKLQQRFSYKGYEIQFKLVSLYTDIDNDKNHIIFQL
jgi:hypothetical protein